MIQVNDYVADVMVKALVAKQETIKRQLQTVRPRSSRQGYLRDRLRDLDEAIAGINTGEGVTREGSA